MQSLVEDICKAEMSALWTPKSREGNLGFVLVLQRHRLLQKIRKIQSPEEDLWKNQSVLASRSE